MATIKDIADSLGISRGTVDRVIHNRGEVSNEIREKVLEKAKELGYKTNKAGRILSFCKKERKIGILMPSINNPFFEDVKRGLFSGEKEYSDFGFSLQLIEVEGFDVDVHLKAISTLSKGSDALILVTLDDCRINSFLDSLDIPFSAMNTDLSAKNKAYYVGSDYRAKGALDAGLLRLYSKEVPNILIVKGSEAMKGHSEAVDGFINTLKKENIKFNLVSLCYSEDNNEIAFNNVKQELKEHPEINCIFVVSAGIDGVVRAIEEKKILVFASDDVPDVKELIKKDKVAWTICQDPFMQGYQAVKKMCEHFIDPDKEMSSYLIKHVVKIKENIEE